MREIRFRAWHKDARKMVEISSIHFGYYRDINNIEGCWIDVSGGDRRVNKSARIEDLEMMQFTGMTDKNGKEIWESDIVKFYEMNAVIKYYKNGFYIDDGISSNWDSEDVEVIGNIYENPELLEDKK